MGLGFPHDLFPSRFLTKLLNEILTAPMDRPMFPAHPILLDLMLVIINYEEEKL